MELMEYTRNVTINPVEPENPDARPPIMTAAIETSRTKKSYNPESLKFDQITV